MELRRALLKGKRPQCPNKIYFKVTLTAGINSEFIATLDEQRRCWFIQ